MAHEGKEALIKQLNWKKTHINQQLRHFELYQLYRPYFFIKLPFSEVSFFQILFSMAFLLRKALSTSQRYLIGSDFQ